MSDDIPIHVASVLAGGSGIWIKQDWKFGYRQFREEIYTWISITEQNHADILSQMNVYQKTTSAEEDFNNLVSKMMCPGDTTQSLLPGSPVSS